MDQLLTDNPALLSPPPVADATLVPTEVSLDLAKQMEAFEPTGQGNPKPTFLIEHVEIGRPYYMGTEQQHVRFDAEGVACVLFNRADEYRGELEKGASVTLLGVLTVNRWNGQTTPQFQIREIIWPGDIDS